MPPNVAVTNFNDPNADMNQDQLLKSVAAYELTRDPGTTYQYSNAGYELLGLVVRSGHGNFLGHWAILVISNGCGCCAACGCAGPA